MQIYLTFVSLCCCCCWVASVVCDSVWPHRRQPTRLLRPWDSPGKDTGVGCHFLLQCMKVKSESEVAQLCLTPGDPMDCSLPGSSVHGVYQARVLEWGAIAFSIAAAAAKLLQSCPTLCDPRDGSPPGSPVPGILQARTPEWVAISFSNAWKCKVKVKLLSRARLLATPWIAAHQAPPSMGFSRQEYWSGVPLPSPISIARECYLSYGEIRICFLLFRAGRGSLLLIITLVSLFGKDFCLFTIIFDYIQSSSLFSWDAFCNWDLFSKLFFLNWRIKIIFKIFSFCPCINKWYQVTVFQVLKFASTHDSRPYLLWARLLLEFISVLLRAEMFVLFHCSVPWI